MHEHWPDELIDKLKSAARDACSNAHAPYSRFPVGAALVTDSGVVFAGCNVENASFGLTICAERNAVAQAVAHGVRAGEVAAMLIYTPGQEAHAPCGACRQVMHEFMPVDAPVASSCEHEVYRFWKMSDLIIDPFKLI